MPDQRSGGERLSPSQVNRWGMAAPWVNAGLETVMGSGVPLGSWLAVPGRARRQPSQAQYQQPPHTA
jgi:hypothetical protein